ncbi:putative 3-hydroxypropionyl-coenzyme A dehydratase [Hypsibius exemplaris]|uniref:3-hydroxypropionyl-coenzyme A dehydratase n=1 Tax=Hypsibius exemplaris TaxID=2072580 RepID=A0A1W0WTX9_HYPEX|nr:putative 3-hydroxypropionyl-coenzyme A dehydratase [Hypsibius exemplaris]
MATSAASRWPDYWVAQFEPFWLGAGKIGWPEFEPHTQHYGHLCVASFVVVIFVGFMFLRSLPGGSHFPQLSRPARRARRVRGYQRQFQAMLTFSRMLNQKVWAAVRWPVASFRPASLRISDKNFSHFYSTHPSIPDLSDTIEEKSASEKLVVTERSGDVFLIAINRPEKRNCVNEETGYQLLEAILEFEKDDAAKVGVLYGKGGTFCAGWDLKSLSGRGTKWVEDLPAFPGPMGPTRNFIRKPMIAAVQGYAVAGGLELSLLCDLRVMEEDAVMGVFCRRYGVPLVDGGTVRLPAIIGFGRAMDLILTGRPINGQEAFEMGLANKVVPRGTAIGQAINLASSIARFPQKCMLADRKSAYYSTFTAKSYEDALVFEHENGKEVILSEAIKGAQGFVSGLGKHGKFNFNTDNITAVADKKTSTA